MILGPFVCGYCGGERFLDRIHQCLDGGKAMREAQAKIWRRPADRQAEWDEVAEQVRRSMAHDIRGNAVTGCSGGIGVEPSKFQLEGGSTRSEKAPPYHLVPREGLVRIAARFGLGADRHGEGNWQKSIHESESSARAFCLEAYNHMMEHALKLVPEWNVIPHDDDLAAIGWAVCAIAYAESYWRKPWMGMER